MIYQIKLDANVKTIRRARKWCQENFGAIPLLDVTQLSKKDQKRIKFVGSRSYAFKITHVYDDVNARWIHRLRNPKTFYFKHKKDMVEFGLRWL